MTRRSLLSPTLAILLVAAGFAGCLGASDEPAPAESAATNESQDLANITDDGTSEMATDVGHMPHLHDYWQGKERVTVMDDEVEVDQFGAVFWTFFNAFRGTPGAVGGAFFRLPEGNLVYEGTGQMEIVATWSDPTVTGAALQYRTPSSETFSEVVPLTQGTPLTLEITPEMTDMPHDKESRWSFILQPAGSGQAIVGKIHFRIDIVRMRDITLFPGHPELFNGANTLVLFDGVAKSTSQSFASSLIGAATGNMGESGVRSSEVVPMETLSMTANVTITSTTATVGQVSNVDFLYKPAGSFRTMRAQVISADTTKGIYQFGWPVEMSQTDSPYAKSSQWTFDLLIRSETVDGAPLPDRGIADTEVDYNLQVVAYDSLLEGIEPMPEDDE